MDFEMSFGVLIALIFVTVSTEDAKEMLTHKATHTIGTIMVRENDEEHTFYRPVILRGAQCGGVVIEASLVATSCYCLSEKNEVLEKLPDDKFFFDTTTEQDVNARYDIIAVSKHPKCKRVKGASGNDITIYDLSIAKIWASHSWLSYSLAPEIYSKEYKVCTLFRTAGIYHIVRGYNVSVKSKNCNNKDSNIIFDSTRCITDTKCDYQYGNPIFCYPYIIGIMNEYPCTYMEGSNGTDMPMTPLIHMAEIDIKSLKVYTKSSSATIKISWKILMLFVIWKLKIFL